MMRQLVALILILSGSGVMSNPYIKYETLLLKNLTDKYSVGVRPVRSTKDAAKVEFDLKLNKLVKLDMKEQILMMNAFILMKWRDPQLSWDPKQYNGTNLINIPNTAIWTPDIVLYNTAEEASYSHLDLYKTPVVAYPSGDILWYCPITLKASCDIDITWFPVDSQTCPLIFGSWTYSKSRLEIKFHKKPASKSDIQGKHAVANGQWTTDSLSVSTGEQNYSCCPEAFSQITYTFALTRKPNFFLLYLIFPCIAIILLALLSFFIPAESGERVGFGVTVLLSFSVYLIVISDKLPEKSDKSPLLGTLYVSLFYLLTMAFTVSIVNVRLVYKTNPPPATLVRMSEQWRDKWNRIKHRKKRSMGNDVKPLKEFDKDNTDTKTGFSNAMVMTELDAKDPMTPGVGYVKDDALSASQCQLVKRDVVSASQCQLMTAEDYQEQWRNIAKMLDKIFFCVALFLAFFIPGCVFISLR